MTKAILAVLFGSLTLLAADVTGTWTGSLKAKRDDGSDHTDTAHVVLKQEGTTLTGYAGGNPDDQRPIQNGKIQGDQVTFEVLIGNGSMRISLKLHPDGNTLAGEIQRERDGNTQTAQLELKRGK